MGWINRLTFVKLRRAQELFGGKERFVGHFANIRKFHDYVSFALLRGYHAQAAPHRRLLVTKPAGLLVDPVQSWALEVLRTRGAAAPRPTFSTTIVLCTRCRVRQGVDMGRAFSLFMFCVAVGSSTTSRMQLSQKVMLLAFLLGSSRPRCLCTTPRETNKCPASAAVKYGS